MERKVYSKLKDWAVQKTRKPLLLRGARQVGKTYAVRMLGKEFDNFVEINFEENREVAVFFSSSLTPQNIVEQLAQYTGQSIVPGKTLLFLDEIQSCPDALRSIRFFYEKMPDLAVIAAGSLLEFTLSEIPSFGVGRISSIFMYPVTFFEFLDATDNRLLRTAIQNAGFGNPLAQPLHNKAMKLLRTYMILGGLPEVIDNYSRTGDALVSQRMIDELILTFRDDFAKYKTRVATEKIDATFNSLAFQAGSKFIYNAVGEGSTTGFSTALDLLTKAGLALKVFHSSCRGIPLKAQIKPNKFKVLPFDTGVYQRLMGLDIPAYLVADDIELVNKGAIAEIFAGLMLLQTFPSHIKPDSFYWQREEKGSNAEVDYVIEHNGRVFPIEVKASKRGSMQSLQLFLKERDLKTGIRIAGEQFSTYQNIKVIPLYAVENIRELLG
ncbi:MAG TPA: AAA family ATPase [bacterium]|nr:AAA family ATPase [bacterium]HPS30887.1 AAA family ATPase [bacterium]